MYSIEMISQVPHVGTWHEGARPAPKPAERLVREDDILAHCLWLERHGQCDLAEEVLDLFCEKGFVPTPHH